MDHMMPSTPQNRFVGVICAGLACGGIANGLLTTSHAQAQESEVTRAIESVKKVHPNLRVTIDKRTGLPTRLRNLNIRTGIARSLGASTRSTEPPTEQAVQRAVEAFFQLSQLRSAFPQGNIAARRVVKSVRPDPQLPGSFIASIKQEVNGIPVFGSSAKVTVNRSLAVTGLSASFSTVDIPDTNATLGKDAAIAKAKTELGKMLAGRTRKNFGLDAGSGADTLDTAKAKASKVIFDPKLFSRAATNVTKTRLAWLVSFASYRLFIDANDGNLLYFYQDHRSFTVRRVFDLGGEQTFPGEDVLNEETGSRSGQVSLDAVTAYRNSGAVRDFYFAMFGRKSFDNGQQSPDQIGGSIVSYVRFGSMKGAHWCHTVNVQCPSAHVAVYGPGYAVALDVMGHEFTHGVIMHESNLVYADESGAVNEALADIIGSLIEQNTGDAAGDWVIGERLPNRGIKSPERSLANPGLSDATGSSLFNAAGAYNSESNRGQPDHFQNYVKRSDPICDTTSDFFNGCVHFNSGILNKFAYMIAAGDTHNGTEVKGIGKEKMAHLAYRALTTKLNGTSGLVDAAFGFVDACYEFAGADVKSFTNENCKEVEKAQQATGLILPGS